MGAPKGRPKPPGSGRDKGTKNKTTVAVKEMLLGALGQAGGQAYLLQQAQENPSAFMTLIGKLIPAEVKQELSGPEGGPVQIQWPLPRTKLDD